MKEIKPTKEQVNHPSHYGGENNPYETIKVMRAWFGDEEVKVFCKLTAFKYMSRCGKKDNNSLSQDISKAEWYLNYIKQMESEK